MIFETTLFFDSKSPLIRGNSQNITATFEPPLLLDQHMQYEIALINANIWYSWFNIRRDNNTFRYYDGSEWIDLRIPIGAYNIDDINKYIKRQLSDEESITIEPNFNTLRSELILKDGYQVDFDIDNSIGSVLGFDKRAVATTTSSDHLVDITSVHSILVHCDLVSESYINGRSGDVIYSFNPNKPPGYLLTEQPNEKTFLPVTRRDRISSINIRITDQEDREIDLNDERTTLSISYSCKKIITYIIVMFLKRNNLTRRKIVGGNLLGNLLNKAKGILYNTTKLMLPKAKSIAKMTAQKALTAAKEQASPENLYDLARDVMKKDRAAVKKKLKAHSKRVANTLVKDEALDPHIRDSINRLSQNEGVRNLLVNKGKELLQDNSRALLSNLISGTGLKRT